MSSPVTRATRHAGSRLVTRALAAVVLSAAVGLVAVLFSSATAGAVPADPNARTVLHQPNGVAFRAKLWGDEHQHGYQTLSGYTIVKNRSTGYWTYALRGPRGRLVPSTSRVAINVPPADLQPGLVAEPRKEAQSGPASPIYPANGPHRSLVILAQFANSPAPRTAAAAWSSAFFGATDSVNHYYREVSYGKFGLLPAAENQGTYADGVIGWLKINTINQPIGSSAEAQVKAAMSAADQYINFANYDSDRDQSIEPNELHITVIAAGYEQATCNTQSVWGHRNVMYGTPPTLDTTKVGVKGYTIFGEVQCTGGEHMATLGIMAHEIGHDLGMPDLYDTDKSSGNGLDGGVGHWSLMASGTWNRTAGTYSGSSPAHLDPFLKSYMGWLTPQQVTGTVNGVQLAASETSARAVQLRSNPSGVDWSFTSRVGTGEYFLVENRQQIGYDAALPRCGVLVWHINETVTYANGGLQNGVKYFGANTEENGPRLVDLEEGDNDNYPKNGGDPWPSTKEFNDSSSPNARLYNGALTGVRVRPTTTSCATTMTVNTSDGSAGPSVPNDNLGGATAVGALPYAQTNINTTAATIETNEQSPNCGSVGRTLWWRFTPATNMRVRAATTGSNYDTVLAAWTGTGLGALTQVACNDDSTGTGSPSAFETDLVAGQTYYFQAGGFGGASGNLNFSLSGVTPPLANDGFGNAFGVSTLPYQASVVTTDATLETGEKTPTCAGIGKTAWWRFTPAVNMRVRAETTGSNYDTVLGGYRGTSLAGLTQVGCNDDSAGAGGPSSFEVDLTAGQTYYFQAGGFSENGSTPASGNLTFKLTQLVIPPANDTFAAAAAVSTLPFSSSVSNVGAGMDAQEPTPSCGNTGRTVWYRYTPSVTTSVTADTQSSSAGFDTVLAAYRGTSLGALTEVGCNDDAAGTGGPSSFQVTLTAGQTYYFQAGGFRGEDGSVDQGTVGFRLTTAGSPDQFGNAAAITALPYTNTGSTATATVEAGEPAPACMTIGKTTWFKYTPAGNQAVTVSTAGSNFDTVLAVWRGTTIGGLTQVGCDDDGVAAGGASRIAGLSLTGGQTYYVQIGGYRDPGSGVTESGSFQLALTTP